MQFMTSLTIKEKLLGQFKFEELRYQYQMPNQQEGEQFAKEIETLYQEALLHNKPYITKEESLNTKAFSNMSLIYGNYFQDEYIFQIIIQPKVKLIMTTEDLSHYQKIIDEEREFNYNEQQEKLLFVHNNMFITISQVKVTEDKIALEKLLAIANELVAE
ncbi:hypothetical protein [Metasolibacillus fluoroglycofenilyticus]|uniref:hypothetical protein n=1 Tax=Metasolibacillus fluoroglycofenilyticus TaxID=1239396 RepID=UPI000D37E812|nr:hypothetical protein [Metasolibacillus fluoroglycofenilyticus]